MIKINLTFVSASGLKRNANAFDIQSVVTLDDLFKECRHASALKEHAAISPLPDLAGI